jgi:hypothetical protein
MSTSIFIIIIFIVLAALLYWLGNCGQWTVPSNVPPIIKKQQNVNLMWALAASGILIYVIYDIFVGTSVFWKIFDILIILLIAFGYYQQTKACNFIRGIFTQKLT